MTDNRIDRINWRDPDIALVKFRPGVRSAPPPDHFMAPAVFCQSPETAGNEGIGQWSLAMDFLGDYEGWLKIARIGWLVDEADPAWRRAGVPPHTFHVYEGSIPVADGMVLQNTDSTLSDDEIEESRFVNHATHELLETVLGKSHEWRCYPDVHCREAETPGRDEESSDDDT